MNLNSPFGFFGAGNIGDESTLQGFAKLISAEGNGYHVWVASRNPAHTAKVEPSFRYYRPRGRDWRRRWANFRTSAQIVVGGTPIMDVLGKWPLSELAPIVRNARDRQERIVFVGSGVEDLKKPESLKLMSETIAPAVAYWTVRSERDKARLLKYGIPNERISVAADLAWTLEPVEADFGRALLTELGVDVSDHLVGVNLTSEQFVVEQEPELFHKLAQFLDAQVESKNSCILFFSNEVREEDSFDKAAATKTVALMKHKQRAVIVPNEYRTPQQTLSLIDCCDFVVSMRYHFCLFAALQNVPFIGLLRSDKVADLCADLDWPYKTSLPALDPKTLFTLASQLEDQKDALRLRLQEQSTEMRRRALTNRIALAALGS